MNVQEEEYGEDSSLKGTTGTNKIGWIKYCTILYFTVCGKS